MATPEEQAGWKKHEAFGALVRRKRTAKKIGLREMARKIDTSPTYLSMIERGEYSPPAEQKVREIARLIDCDEDELLKLAGRVPSDLRDIIKERALEWGPFLRKVEAIERTAASVGYNAWFPSAPLPTVGNYSVRPPTVGDYSVPPPTVGSTEKGGLASDLTEIIREYPEELAALLRAIKGVPPDKWADIWQAEFVVPRSEKK